MNKKTLTGRIAPEKIKMLSVPSVSTEVVAAFKSMGDVTGLVSDTLDMLGIPGTISASTLKPLSPGQRIVGPALTVRNMAQVQHDPYVAAAEYQSRRHGRAMAEIEAHNLAQPGDVLVIDGVRDVSNMGGISAELGKLAGEEGAIVFGGIRDISHMRDIGYQAWSTEVTPSTGKWRVETVEINGDIQVDGVRVSPGDLIVADDTGVCVIPRDRIQEVLKITLEKSAGEDDRVAKLRSGTPLLDIYYLPE